MSKITPSNRTADLGNDPVGRLLVRLALPTITAQIVNLLYNIVDRIYIGRIPLEGKLALTGMGVTFPVITLISAFSALVGMGGAPRASIALGAGEKDRAERTLGTCAAALWSLAAVLTVLFLLFQRDLLRLFGASADTLPYAMQYLSIYVLGTVFVMTALGLNGFITAQGRSSVAMKTVVIGAILNVLLDPLFIFVLGLGVRGAAVATVLSQAVSAAWVLRFLTGKNTVLRLRRSTLRRLEGDARNVGRTAACGSGKADQNAQKAAAKPERAPVRAHARPLYRGKAACARHADRAPSGNGPGAACARKTAAPDGAEPPACGRQGKSAPRETALHADCRVARRDESAARAEPRLCGRDKGRTGRGRDRCGGAEGRGCAAHPICKRRGRLPRDPYRGGTINGGKDV